MDPTALPPVPATILPAIPSARQLSPTQPVQRHSLPRPTSSGPATLFDAPPTATLAARQKADACRAALRAALGLLATAKTTADDALALTKDTPEAAAILIADGLSPEVLKKFTKLAAPLLEAFLAPVPAPEPAPVAA